jgi:carboxypeptidase C (cathepsin A)
MFYWFVNKVGGNVSTDTVPVIMWLQGGPGCSSMTGALFEFGPIYINETLNMQNRTGSWINNYHLLFVDNPVGAGYSVKGPNSHYVSNQYQMATNLYALLQNLTVIHPEIFKNHDFYIFGESYAGKYIPSIAYYILHWNGNTTTTGFNPIPLKGVGIGDGISDPIPQYTSYSDYGFAAGLIDEYERETVEIYERQLVEYINKEDWPNANKAQNDALMEVVVAGGNVNYNNIRIFEGLNVTSMDTWLNSNATKAMFHVPTNITFLDCGTLSYNALANDIPQSITGLFPYLLNNTRVLLYEGQDDLILNMVGAESWISQLQWYGQTQYLSALKEMWVVDGALAGYVRGFDNLTQLVVLNSGHMVPIDQLPNSLDMVTRFITNAPWSK